MNGTYRAHLPFPREATQAMCFWISPSLNLSGAALNKEVLPSPKWALIAPDLTLYGTLVLKHHWIYLVTE